jgi:hypothetical protein
VRRNEIEMVGVVLKSDPLMENTKESQSIMANELQTEY